MKGTLKLTIDKKITEQLIIENCLMYYNSGYEYMPFLSLYALAERWNINKLIYYINLIKGSKND